MESVAAVLMASGFSTRFRPLNRRHKSLIEIHGKPLLRRTAEQLSSVDKIVVVHRPEDTAEISRIVEGFDVTFVEHKRELIKGGRSVLKVAYPEIKRFDLVVMLSPYHLGVSSVLDDLVALARERGVALVVSPSRGSEQYGNAIIRGGLIRRVLEKKRTVHGRKISAIYVMRSDLVERLVSEGEALYDRVGEAVLEFFLDELARKRGIPYVEASFPSLKYPRHALDRLEFLREIIKPPRNAFGLEYHERTELRGATIRNSLVSPDAEIKHGALVEDSIVMGDVMEYAVVKRSFVGRGSLIGTHALVRGSSIGHGSLVGAFMEVARSVLVRDVHTHSGYLGDSVVDVGTRLGAGTIAANARLDRKPIVVETPKGRVDSGRPKLGAILGRDVRVGINVSFMPGSMIGSRSIVYPGAIVKGLRPEGSVIRRNFILKDPSRPTRHFNRRERTPHMPTVLTEIEAKELAKKYGIPVPRGGLARNVDEALKLAEEIGYPVVLKIVSPDILHKTDVGGVRVGISNPDELREAFEGIMENVRRNKPDARIEGILVEEMIPGGHEVIIGGKYDETFKHVIMFGGVGGIFVELFKDVSFRLAPIDEEEAERMMSETIGYKILKGFRGFRGDIDGLKRMIARVSEMLVKEDILELDLNPVKVFPDRVVALDVKVIKRRVFSFSGAGFPGSERDRVFPPPLWPRAHWLAAPGFPTGSPSAVLPRRGEA